MWSMHQDPGRSFTAQQRANEGSLRVPSILGQRKKTFTDGGAVKERGSAAAETLLEGKQKEELWYINEHLHMCQNDPDTVPARI